MNLLYLHIKIKNKIYKKYINFHYTLFKKKLDFKIQKILRYKEEDLGIHENNHIEHALPGFRRYNKTGHNIYMLSRYLYCIKKIKNKIILDSGCGLGWGAYLISDYPSKILAIDKDPKAIEFAKNNWKLDKIQFLIHSILDLDSLNNQFDVILGMEVIEHLNQDDCILYLKQCFKNLKNNGILILSSSFPEFSENLSKQKINNRYHLKIYTKQELISITKKIGYTKIKFFGKFMALIYK